MIRGKFYAGSFYSNAIFDSYQPAICRLESYTYIQERSLLLFSNK